MSIRKWWEEQDEAKCTYNDLKYCLQYGECDLCELFPLNIENSNTLECKQITIEEIINGNK